MKKKGLLTKISKIMIIFLIPVLLISMNSQLLFNPLYLKWEYFKTNFPEPTTITERERMILSRSVLAYVKDITDIATLRACELFTEQELIHLNDVRILNNKLIVVKNISSLLVVYAVLFSVLTDKNRRVLSYVLAGSIISLLIGLLVTSLVFVDFDSIFIIFHKILFPQGYWIFGNQDLLIQLYPKKFWVDSAVIIVGLLLIESLVLILSSLYLKERLKKRKS